jgi:flagellar hook assembly protein FlgD
MSVGLPIDNAAFGQFNNAYPNPFYEGTTLEYTVDQNEDIVFNIYNSMGQLVRCLVKGRISAGHYTQYWDGKDAQGNDLPAGLYITELRAGGRSINRKIMKSAY